MPLYNPQKTVSPAAIPCGGTARVTLSFEAGPELSRQPARIALVLDRSDSLRGQPLAALQQAARQLVTDLARASGSPDGSALMNGTRMGLCSFSDICTRDAELTRSVGGLHAAIDRLQPGTAANHHDAFVRGTAMLGPAGGDRRILILFTDSYVSSAFPDPLPAALAARQAGVEIYCIGLLSGPEQLRQWASPPADQHVFSTEKVGRLAQQFARTGARVAPAGALDVRIREELGPHFRIARLYAPENGAVVRTGERTFNWNMDHVGAAGREKALLFYDLAHDGVRGGRLPVSTGTVYSDRQGPRPAFFPEPLLTVNCPEPPPPPEAFDFAVPGCRDAVQVRLPPVEMKP